MRERERETERETERTRVGPLREGGRRERARGRQSMAATEKGDLLFMSGWHHLRLCPSVSPCGAKS